MTKELAIRQNGIPALSVGPFEATPVGLVVNGDEAPYEVWEAYGGALRRVGGAIHWVIGDWLNYGERAYGEKYSQALDDTGLEYQALANDKWVSGQVEFSLRKENLTWSHHMAIAPLEPDEQVYWLIKAETENLSVQKLRQEIRESKRAPKLALAPSDRSPRLIVARAEDMPQVETESIDLIITSPPYNMGQDPWPMGGDGRLPRENGIGYTDERSEDEYQAWQLDVFIELYRVAKQGASFFYNHKVRSQKGEIIHPMDWLRNGRNPWMIRQEIIWDRGSTHNHSATLFWPEDERIYWMTKGKPTLPDRPVGRSTVWRFHGPVADTWHPAPFDKKLPRRCIEAVGRNGIVVLDPFAGSCTTLAVALEYGYDAIGIDISAEYLEKARRENGWTIRSEI